MFFLFRPSSSDIERFIDRSRGLPLTYSPVGLVYDDTAGRNFDDSSVVIGHGREDYERSRAALASWRPFDLGWVELFPKGAPWQPDTVVAVLIRHLGFWSLNGARVVYTRGDRDRGEHFGFAYGTLPNHAERGEELFEVALNPDSGEVTYRIRAVSWPHATLAHLGYPIVRFLQAQFRRDSAEAMRRATRGRDPQP